MIDGEMQDSRIPANHYQTQNLSKQQLLDQIKADIIEHNICSHLAEQANGLVFGEGDPDTDIVFIGEAPGKREDELLQPFVGASGKFLAEMLASVNLKREQVYITNIVKYRPPQNRDPLPEEKKQFLPFLVQQLKVIKPLLVVTLGRHSGEAFIPGLKISQQHGQPLRIRIKADDEELITVILPLYHPAAALYNGSQREVLMEDFSRIPAIVQKIRNER